MTSLMVTDLSRSTSRESPIQLVAVQAGLAAGYWVPDIERKELITKDLTYAQGREIVPPLPRVSDSRKETTQASRMERMYTIKEICKELGVTRRSVHYWIARGELKAFHLGGKRITRVWEKDLRGFVKRTGR